jgi:hypothetical protein
MEGRRATQGVMKRRIICPLGLIRGGWVSETSTRWRMRNVARIFVLRLEMLEQQSGVPRDMNNYFTGSSTEKCSRNTALKQSPIYTTSREFQGSYYSGKYCLKFFCLLGYYAAYGGFNRRFETTYPFHLQNSSCSNTSFFLNSFTFEDKHDR